MELCRQSHAGLASGAVLREVSARKSDPTIEAINNLPVDLRQKVLSQAWADMAAVVNEHRTADGKKTITSTGDFEKDWQILENAVWKLFRLERERVLEAFYSAVNKVLRQHIEQKECATHL